MRSSSRVFLFEEMRRVEVKGKRQPLEVFPLKGIQTLSLVERPPLIGRKQDLLQLSLLEARVTEEQRPQSITILAPAGTGKTRLLEEFLPRLDPEGGFEVATVRCLPYGQTLTYWPLRGLLTGLLHGEETTKARLQTTFEEGGYKREDATRLAGLILATLGSEGESPSSTDRESLFSAWRLLIEVFARQTPRILVFEDLHWASDSLLDLVEHLLQLRSQCPLLVIILSRPELLDRRPFLREDMALQARNVNLALASGDNAQLAAAIDEAEAHGMVVHTARMRIVLARRAHEPAQLERAREVLERIGDRRFLKKLEQAAAELGQPA